MGSNFRHNFGVSLKCQNNLISQTLETPSMWPKTEIMDELYLVYQVHPKLSFLFLFHIGDAAQIQ